MRIVAFCVVALFFGTASAKAEDAAGSLRPAILLRSEWQAEKALPGLIPQTITGIIVHHTGEKRNMHVELPVKLRNLQHYSQRAADISPGHRKPQWPDLPYHYYIDAVGIIGEGRDIGFAGSTNTNYSPVGFVQVVVEGNFDIEQPGQAQLAALKKLLLWLSLTQNVTADKISLHNDHAATSCPGKNLKALVPAMLVEIKAESITLRGQK